MTQFPADILASAQEAVTQISARMEGSPTLGAAATEIIAEALAAERERCAKVAEEDCRTAMAIEHDYKPTWYSRAQAIAAAIRSPDKAPE